MAVNPNRFSVATFAGKLHHHGCTRCGHKYGDACKTPEVNAWCNSCHCGRVIVYQQWLFPVACCVTDCTQASKDDRRLYKLAGPTSWWICRSCYRQFPFLPKEIP